MIDSVAAVLGLVSAGIFLAHAIESYRAGPQSWRPPALRKAARSKLRSASAPMTAQKWSDREDASRLRRN
jgi:hypothetical protein